MIDKTLILVWKQDFVNLPITCTDNFWGIGDLIRGTIASIQISKKYNLKLIIDINNHPISKFLIQKDTIYTEQIYNKNDINFIVHGMLDKYINEFIKDDSKKTLFFGTNEFCNEDMITECEKQIIKDILLPNMYFKKIIENTLISLPSNFTIQHYRLGDAEIVRNINTIINIDYFNILLNKIKTNYTNTDILLSDSTQFKQYIKEKFNIFLFSNEIGHLGCEKNILKLENTLLEFFIISKSKKIKTYRWTGSTYISGFVNWTSKIYDVPLEIIH